MEASNLTYIVQTSYTLFTINVLTMMSKRKWCFLTEELDLSKWLNNGKRMDINYHIVVDNSKILVRSKKSE